MEIYLTRFKVIQQYGQCFRFLSIIFDDNTTRPNNLSRIALPVQNTQSRPFTKFLPIRNFDKIDIMFRTKRLN